MVDELLPGNYVYPTLVEIDSSADILKHELFVPILYLCKFKVIFHVLIVLDFGRSY